MSNGVLSTKRKAVAIETSPPPPAKKNALISSFFKVDQATITTSAATAKPAFKSFKFDKEAFLATLSDEEKELLSLEIDSLGESWLAAGLKDEIRKPYFLKLKRTLRDEAKSHTIFPPPKDIYTWSGLTPLDKVRVVIIGQDPYHNVNQAHGLCFSVQKPTPPPPSLVNIYKEIKTEYPDFTIPKHGNLSNWAKQGVLLLNTSLTVQAHQAASHANHGWHPFTTRVLELVVAHSASLPAKGCVFLCWGQHAQKRAEAVLARSASKHLVLKSVHPSPLSAHRGFFGNGHFKKPKNGSRNARVLVMTTTCT